MSIHIIHLVEEIDIIKWFKENNWKKINLIICFDQDSLQKLQSTLLSSDLKDELHIEGIKSDIDIAYEQKKGRKRAKPEVSKGSSEASVLEHYTIAYSDQGTKKGEVKDENDEGDGFDTVTQKLLALNDEFAFDLSQMCQLPIFKKQIVEAILPELSIQSKILFLYSKPEQELLTKVLSIVLLLSFNELCYNAEISAGDYEITYEAPSNHTSRLEFDYNGDGNKAIHTTSEELLTGDNLEGKVSEMLLNLITRLDWNNAITEVSHCSFSGSLGLSSSTLPSLFSFHL
jgi:hypothetical protein